MIRTPDQMEATLRQIGEERYHHLHPFHELLHSGGCTKDQVRAWALNRYCYQRTIPIKDTTMLARLDAIYHVYVNGHPCPGAWQPGDAMVAEAA